MFSTSFRISKKGCVLIGTLQKEAFHSRLNRQIENIFVNDLFFLVEDAEIYNYVCNHGLENVVSKLDIVYEQFLSALMILF